MDGLRFDALTRRRAGLGVGAFVAGLANAGGRDAAAKKGKKKKCPKCRGRNLGASCQTNRDCCADDTNLACGHAVVGELGETVCCGAAEFRCGGDGDCCEGLLCSQGRCRTPIP